MTTLVHVPATRISYVHVKFLSHHSQRSYHYHIKEKAALHNKYTMKRPIIERSDGIKYTALNLPVLEMVR